MFEQFLCLFLKHFHNVLCEPKDALEHCRALALDAGVMLRAYSMFQELTNEAPIVEHQPLTLPTPPVEQKAPPKPKPAPKPKEQPAPPKPPEPAITDGVDDDWGSDVEWGEDDFASSTDTWDDKVPASGSGDDWDNE